jgi:hypothetical protein
MTATVRSYATQQQNRCDDTQISYILMLFLGRDMTIRFQASNIVFVLFLLSTYNRNTRRMEGVDSNREK